MCCNNCALIVQRNCFGEGVPAKNLSLGLMTQPKLDRALLRSLPKVLLHEHLDGVLRPPTIVELAREIGYSGLPTSDPEELAAWFYQGADKGNLGESLQGFAHTIAVMQ